MLLEACITYALHSSQEFTHLQATDRSEQQMLLIPPHACLPHVSFQHCYWASGVACPGYDHLIPLPHLVSLTVHYMHCCMVLVDHNVAGPKTHQLPEMQEPCKRQRHAVANLKPAKAPEHCASLTIAASISTVAGDLFTTGLANDLCYPSLVSHTKGADVGATRPAVE